MQSLMKRYEKMDEKARESWILKSLQGIVQRVYSENRFYRHHYQSLGYHPDRLTTLRHFADVPTVSKADLRNFDLEERSDRTPGRIRVNSGGTSGEPLEFFVDGGAFGREWAHMHWIWKRAGYDQRHLKITLRGHNLGDQVARYNAVHNEFIFNAYADKDELVRALSTVMKRARVEWVHGYPSLVADFAYYLEAHHADVARQLSSSLRGVLLGSEFPSPLYRARIERVLSKNVVAWYGQSEMCVLAYERHENEYIPMHTYGFAEAVTLADRQDRLIGTSYWNLASPFIRYDTGDTVRPLSDDGILSSFAVEEGRVGDFVINRQGTRIALTSLIFGRHHPAFGRLAHVQVRQSARGRIEILLVPLDARDNRDEIVAGFDFCDSGFDVDYTFNAEPVRTSAGKVALLVQ